MAKFPGFVGPAYQVRSPNVECQKLINWFIEQNELGTGKDGDVLTAVCTPGLELFTTTGNGPVRAAYLTSTGRVFVVSGPGLYEIFSDGAASALLGTLNTSEGFVSIADNGYQVILVDGTGYIYNMNAATFVAISDPDFPTADYVAYVDGYFLVNQHGTQNIYFSALRDGTSWDGLDFFAKEGAPDNVRCILAHKGHLWVFGDLTMEVFYNSGDALNPIQRIPGAFLESGIAAPATAKVLDGAPYWVGLDRDGRVGVFRANGYTPERVSTFGVEQAISGYGDISDATAWKYQEDGHHFYLLNFNGAKTTWCLDTATGMWHERVFASDTTGTLIVFQQNLTVDSPAVPWRVDSGKNPTKVYDGGGDYGTDPLVELPATLALPALLQTGDEITLSTVAETVGGIPIAPSFTSNADGTFGTGGTAAQYDGPPHATTPVEMVQKNINVVFSDATNNFGGGFLDYSAADDSLVFLGRDGYLRKFDCRTEVITASVLLGGFIGELPSNISNVSGGKCVVYWGSNGRVEVWNVVTMARVATYASGTFSPSSPVPASNMQYHEPSDSLWTTEGASTTYNIFRYRLAAGTRTEISSVTLGAPGNIKLDPNLATAFLAFSDGGTIGTADTASDANIFSGPMTFTCGSAWSGLLDVDIHGSLYFSCNHNLMSGHLYQYERLALTQTGILGSHFGGIGTRPNADAIPSDAALGHMRSCRALGTNAAGTAMDLMAVGGDTYWDITVVDTASMTAKFGFRTTPSLSPNGSGSFLFNGGAWCGLVASTTALWGFINDEGVSGTLSITKLILRRSPRYPDFFLSQEYGAGALVGCFTDNSDAMVGSPFYLGYGPLNLTRPVGATKLSLGINDIFFEDNYNAGVIGTYTVQIIVARTITQLGSLHRHRGQDHVFAFNKHLVGDYQNGSIYEMSRDFLTDSGVNITRERTAPHLGNDGHWLFYNLFQVDMETGKGPTPPLLDGNGVERQPQAMIQWSDDGGHSWSNEHWVDMGKAGEYRKRAILRRLGRSRDRVFRLKITDPVEVTLLGAFIEATPGTN